MTSATMFGAGSSPYGSTYSSDYLFDPHGYEPAEFEADEFQASYDLDLRSFGDGFAPDGFRRFGSTRSTLTVSMSSVHSAQMEPGFYPGEFEDYDDYQRPEFDPAFGDQGEFTPPAGATASRLNVSAALTRTMSAALPSGSAISAALTRVRIAAAQLSQSSAMAVAAVRMLLIEPRPLATASNLQGNAYAVRVLRTATDFSQHGWKTGDFRHMGREFSSDFETSGTAPTRFQDDPVGDLGPSLETDQVLSTTAWARRFAQASLGSTPRISATAWQNVMARSTLVQPTQMQVTAVRVRIAEPQPLATGSRMQVSAVVTKFATVHMTQPSEGGVLRRTHVAPGTAVLATHGRSTAILLHNGQSTAVISFAREFAEA